jgi:hypothetical protein
MHEQIQLPTWGHVDQYLEQSSIKVSLAYLERVVQGNYPRDAFSKGQLVSKVWLLERLARTGVVTDKQVIAILGCWVGSLVDFLITQYDPDRVYGIDLDPAAVEMAEQFNQHHVQNHWKFKGVVADVSMLNTSAMIIQTGGELIEAQPNIVINTSCEHMGTEWFHSAGTGQLIVMQTNNSTNFDGHINVCESISQMQEKYPLRNTLYIGEMVTPVYTRFMQIGYY